MTEYERKFDAAMDELRTTEMWTSNHSPPALRVLKALGFKARPPHYANLWIVFCSSAVWFAVVWGLIMWFVTWRAAGFTGLDAAGASAFAGVLFGAFMSVYYRRGRKKYGLTRWDDL